MRFNNAVVRSQSLEFIWSRYKRKSSEVCYIFRYQNIITFRCIQSGSNCSSTQSQFFQMVKCIVDCFFRVIQLRNITREFLSKRQRRRIHQVRSSNFYDVLELFRFLVKCISQFFQSRQSIFHHFRVSCDVHCCWISIVGRLRFVHIVIRVHQSFLAKISTVQNVRSVGNHFIHIHIGLRTRTRLPDDKRKLIVQFSFKDFITNFPDQVSFFIIKNA